ncbi:MAG: hypothetical protein V2A56_02475, partial [bacterium]
MMLPLSRLIATTLDRFHSLGETGILDPESKRNGYANPRFQEACLTLALAVEEEIGLPADARIAVVEASAIRAMDQWFRMTDRSGGVRCSKDGLLDPQATAYGLFATAKTMSILGDRAPNTVRIHAQKVMRRSAKFLRKTHVPPGLETKPLRAAALSAAGHWLGDSKTLQVAANVRRDALKKIRDAFASPDPAALDFGALALSLAYLTLSANNPEEEERAIWKMIGSYALRSTMDNGIPGGGAESTVASLPIPTGFSMAAEVSPEAATVSRLIEQGWKNEWFDPMLDPDVPWLTPIGYLALIDRVRRPEHRKLARLAESAEMNLGVDSHGAGRLSIDDWCMRLGRGGTVGWLYHKPSQSTRVFGSPAGLALREGPWIIEGNRLRHPAYAGKFKVTQDTAVAVEGQIHSIPIPGTERSPRRIGQPDWHDREALVGTRLAPPSRPGSSRASGAVPYSRRIEIKDGALVIETNMEGQILHRIPIIWIGGHAGEIQVDKTTIEPGYTVQERRVREMVFSGGPWPDWTLRFDRPVDILYEPIHTTLTSGPLRYLSAATGTLDIVT